MNFSMFGLDKIKEKIIARQNAELDEAVFEWLENLGYSFEKTTIGIQTFLRKEGLEIISKNELTENGRLFRYELIKVLSHKQILLKTPKIKII